MLLLGLDIGSSSVKASILDAQTGKEVGTAFYPESEMEIIAHKSGWAEQHPDSWWDNAKLAIAQAAQQGGVDKQEIRAIGISYQMHGLVMLDKEGVPLRASIIWCDSRAVNIGNKAYTDLGEDYCLEHYLNSPGNFTASKLAWVIQNEPELFEKAHQIMLPGDYIALKLTGESSTTISGLSEGILWDFKENKLATELLDYYGASSSLIPEINDTFSIQGNLLKSVAEELGLLEGIPVSYRAGDQPNNALSLNVLNPGEIAATAGTSGVVYGVSEQIKYDRKSRVNSFAHVNHTQSLNRLGVLLCINGTGILNSWLRKNIASTLSYEAMNLEAEKVNIGSDGLVFTPFGNGSERVLENKEIGAGVSNLNFNIHTQAHMLRAAQEGIVFSFKYGMDVMKEIGIDPSVIRAGKANMFLSPIFRNTLSGVTGAVIELYNTDGALGAARAAGFGAGIYNSLGEAFETFEKEEIIEPSNSEEYLEAYNNWLLKLENK